MTGTAASPKRPMPKVIAQMIQTDARNAAAIAKVGWQRAVSHNSSGTMKAPGLNESQDPVFCAIVYEQATTIRPSTPVPTIHSFRGGGWRHVWAIPMTSGATTTSPTQLERNHSRQTSANGAMVSGCTPLVVRRYAYREPSR